MVKYCRVPVRVTWGYDLRTNIHLWAKSLPDGSELWATTFVDTLGSIAAMIILHEPGG